MADLKPSEKPEVADGIAVPDLWKTYSTGPDDTFTVRPPPASQEQ